MADHADILVVRFKRLSTADLRQEPSRLESVFTVTLRVVETMRQSVQLSQCDLQLQPVSVVLRRQLQQILRTETLSSIFFSN